MCQMMRRRLRGTRKRLLETQIQALPPVLKTDEIQELFSALEFTD